MPPPLTSEQEEARRLEVLQAARWCFLNFGFSKTTLQDIAGRAGLSRTLLYQMFDGKDDIFAAVFAHWLIARLPEAREAARRAGDPAGRLLDVCRAAVLEPWTDMAGTPMGAEFFEVCERVDPEISGQHRGVVHECVAEILGSEESAEVFLLALDGLLADEPSPEALEGRVVLLVDRFAPAAQAQVP